MAVRVRVENLLSIQAYSNVAKAGGENIDRSWLEVESTQKIGDSSFRGTLGQCCLVWFCTVSLCA